MENNKVKVDIAVPKSHCNDIEQYIKSVMSAFSGSVDGISQNAELLIHLTEVSKQVELLGTACKRYEQEMRKKIESQLLKAKTEVAKIEERMGKCYSRRERSRPATRSWSTIATNNARTADPGSVKILKRPVKPIATKIVSLRPCDIKLTAVCVESKDQIRSGPTTPIYCLPNGKLAISINKVPIVLASGLGEMLTNRQLINCTECWGGERCKGNGDPNKCTHYHDPDKYPTSNNLRNFPDRLKFWPASERLTEHLSGCYLRIGNGSTFKQDIKKIGDTDLRFAKDYAGQMLLVRYLLERFGGSFRR